MNNENRRQFLQKLGIISIATCSNRIVGLPSTLNSINPFQQVKKTDFKSLYPADIFSVLNLDLPRLEKVKQVLNSNGFEKALLELLKYYRVRNFGDVDLKGSKNASVSITRGDDVVNHIFQWGPYKAFNYGTDIDWAADPAGDIEWVASMYRFNWANDLANAYLATGDEKYARSFIELTTDWIKKHPLEKTIDIVHPVYKEGVYGSSGWKGYPWLDLQTGIRASNICRCFKVFIHSKAFTPHFLGTLLSSLYDHQYKTEKMPMNKVHNKAIFEQRGFFNVMYTFPEYKDKDRWLDIGIEITCENLLAQTTSDGVQREWCGGYHLGVYRDALEIENRAKSLGREMPAEYYHRLKRMADHIFGISTPDLGFPMFGDTARDRIISSDRKEWPLYNVLLEATEKFGDSQYKALAELNIQQLPTNGSVAFPDAGLYTMRNKWTNEQIYMPLHCSLPAYSIHDTPDNGTFELYAYGQWLMPDTGFYTYGHDPKSRAWHRQTKTHATMTVNGEDTNVAGRQLLWNSNSDEDILCIENHSYRYFVHRRTVWFMGKRSEMPFFVILDEAIGDARGDIAIHFPMAPGSINIDNSKGLFNTEFEEVNLLVQVAGKKPIDLVTEEGWYSWKYGEREKRTIVSAVYSGEGPFAFISLLVPYKGRNIPNCQLNVDTKRLIAGADPFDFDIEVNNKKWVLKRKL